MIVPACGPIYAFGKQWLRPPAVAPEAVRLAGMPNAFPSLHIGTALVFSDVRAGQNLEGGSASLPCRNMPGNPVHWRALRHRSDSGLAFGVFVSAIGMRNYRRAGCFLALTLSWSLGVRFGYTILLAHPMLLRSLAGLTVVSAALALGRQWSAAPALEAGHDIQLDSLWPFGSSLPFINRLLSGDCFQLCDEALTGTISTVSRVPCAPQQPCRPATPAHCARETCRHAPCSDAMAHLLHFSLRSK